MWRSSFQLLQLCTKQIMPVVHLEVMKNVLKAQTRGQPHFFAKAQRVNISSFSDYTVFVTLVSSAIVAQKAYE